MFLSFNLIIHLLVLFSVDKVLFSLEVLYLYYFLGNTLTILLFFEYSKFKFIFILVLINTLVYSLIYLILNFDNIQFLVLFIVLISLNDVMGYLVGRSFGKYKIFPKISPKKTLEGTFSGIFFATLASFIFAFYYDQNIEKFIFLGLLLSILGTSGDLIISIFKRHINIKDTGSLIPGHGGVLDRFDSYLLSIPAGIIFIEFFLIVN